jgi:serine/threonine protein kinase
MNLREIVPYYEVEGIELLEKMLEVDKDKRISASEGMNHKYFEDIDKMQMMKFIEVKRE